MLRTYQSQALNTAVFPEKTALSYLTLGIISELGEIADIIKKAIRNNQAQLTSLQRSELYAELGDLLWYVAIADYKLFGAYNAEELAPAACESIDNSLDNLSFLTRELFAELVKLINLTAMGASINLDVNLLLNRADQVTYPESFYLRITRLVAKMALHLNTPGVAEQGPELFAIEDVLNYNLCKLNFRLNTNTLKNHD
jgi:NTP pyrophosphatase (non-canonical NTP hydrolase)